MGFSRILPTGLTHCDVEKASPGYTLFAMIYGRTIYLIDLKGEVAHTWSLPDELLSYSAELLDNGNILVLGIAPTKEYRPGGCTTVLELDWAGKVVWRFDSPMIHHTAYRRTNGNTFVVEWAPLPDALQTKLRSHRVARWSGEPKGPMLGDTIREVAPDGRTVSLWESHTALDPDVDLPCPLHRYDEWTHCNALDERSDGTLVLTFRLIDTIAFLDRQTGKLTWKWGPGVVGHPHDTTWLPNGNLLTFDNEWHSLGKLDHSRILEIEPNEKKIVWSYASDPKCAFFSGHLGAAQRMPNGNTLICEGSSGRLFEVTSGGEIVWEYLNPYRAKYRDDSNSPRILKARRYSPTHPGLAGRL